ncbi:MAG: DUF3772 domain-containing protein [Alsobacter sp.]
MQLPRIAMRALRTVLVAGGLVAASPSVGQQPPDQPAAATVPSSTTVQSPAVAARAKLESMRIQLDQLEAGLERRGKSDDALLALRALVVPLADSARVTIADIAPRGDAIRSRLKELGPKPDEKSPPESTDVAREREERQAALTEIDETTRIGRALVVQADQIDTQITGMRRDLFARRLFESSDSILAPRLWAEVLGSIPHDFRAAVQVGSDAVERAGTRLNPKAAFAVLGALLLAVLLIVPVRRFALTFAKRDRLAGQPSRLDKAMAAAMITILGSAGPMLAAFLIFQIVQSLDLLPPRLLPVFATMLGGAAFIAVVRSLADGMLAPDRRNWRLLDISDERAAQLMRVDTLIAFLVVLRRVLESFYQTIAAGLKLTAMTNAVVALLIALALARTLQLIRKVDPEDEEAFGPHVGTSPDYTGLLRLVGWAFVAAIVAAVLLGYLAFAWFLAEQIVWAALVIPTLSLLLTLTDEGSSQLFSANGRASKTFHATVGLSRRSLEQFGVLVGGLGRLLLIAFGILLLLAPWGVETGDVMASVRVAFFGFTLGGVTVSPSNVLMAIVLFIGGIVGTRALQRWLQARYFPHTGLDAGLKNSISTGIGYAGVVLASAIAVSFLGLSLDKLTIVAGALSVGIGFGLQSIVNNFVSGLILLAERGIRVGDWVVVGADQGHVRRINVRATEIDTFDRGTLIVPNSTLVSGTVKNWVHGDRTGRVLITVPVPRDADPDLVARILRDAAIEHPDVLEDPAPRVLLKSITDTNLIFDLIAFVPEIETVARISSDISFVVVRQLRDAKVVVPAGPAKLEIDGLNDLRNDMNAIRERLALTPDSDDPLPLPPVQLRPTDGTGSADR